ncbi:MAG: polysaccharide biosynthesis/export family protein [Flavobacteriales bacterium]
MRYLQTEELDTGGKVAFKKNTTPYLIRPGDNLFIDIKSLDPTVTEIFNLKSDYRSDPYNESSLYLNSYEVDTMGCILIPVCGRICLGGKDLPTATAVVQDSIGRYFTQSYVTMKLVNAEITVLGEVSHPGTIKVNETEISLLKALSLAGDMTEYGERRSIQIIREGIDEVTIEEIDLTQPDAMASASFFLHPGDAVYVPPIGLKPLETNLGPIRTLFQIVGTAFIGWRIFN